MQANFFMTSKHPCKCVNIFEKICSRHSYIFEKGLFNTAGRLPLLEGGAECENSEDKQIRKVNHTFLK